MLAGVRACSSAHALGQYQRDNKDKSIEGESVSERLQSIARQEVLGARTLVQKGLSHLVDRKLMEATQFAFKRGRKVRTHYRLTDRGRMKLAVDDLPEEEIERIESEARRKKISRTKRQLTPEQRSEAARRAAQARTPEQRSEISRRAAQTRKERAAARSPEERKAVSAKGWETRKRKEAERKARVEAEVTEILKTNEPRTPAELFKELRSALGHGDDVDHAKLFKTLSTLDHD